MRQDHAGEDNEEVYIIQKVSLYKWCYNNYLNIVTFKQIFVWNIGRIAISSEPVHQNYHYAKNSCLPDPLL